MSTIAVNAVNPQSGTTISSSAATLSFDANAAIDTSGNTLTLTDALTVSGALTASSSLTVGTTLGVTGATTVAAITASGTITANAAIGIDMGTTGNRIDLDTDNDTSIRASADDVLTVEVGGTDRFTLEGSGNATMRVDCDSGASTNLYLQEAGSFKYNVSYAGGPNYFRIESTDIDGGGTDGDIIRILDGQTSVDGNGTFDDNAFDYVCDDCGWHHVEEHDICPECGGNVQWHDDVALMATVVQNIHKDKGVIRKLEKLGVVNTYGTLDTEKPELFTSMNKMPWFLMSGMVQMSNRIDQLEMQLQGA